MNAISDPGRPTRRDRRRAQKLVDTAFAERRLTAADRALRTERIQAAHTRGDLSMITRDIVAPTQANLGRALDPSGGTSRWHAGSGQRGTMSSMRAGSLASLRRTLGTPAPVGSRTPTIDLSGLGRRVRLFILLAVVGVFASCVLGILALVIPAVVGFNGDVNVSTTEAPGASVTDEPRQPPSASTSLHSVAGWTALVRAVESESGTTEVYDLVAYPQYASVGLDGKGAMERRFYRDGAWQDSVSVRTPVVGSLIDLAEIDPNVIARLPGETAQHFGVNDPTGTYIIVNAFTGDPQIAVYVQSNGESRYRTYRLDGTARS